MSNAMATFPHDYLPPEGFFESRQALFESINTWAATRGYAFTTQRSSRERNGYLKIFYACDRSRRPPSSRERQKKTTAQMTNCPFSILAKESSESWTLKHRPDQPRAKPTPNCAPSSSPTFSRHFTTCKFFELWPCAKGDSNPCTTKRLASYATRCV